MKMIVEYTSLKVFFVFFLLMCVYKFLLCVIIMNITRPSLITLCDTIKHIHDNNVCVDLIFQTFLEIFGDSVVRDVLSAGIRTMARHPSYHSQLAVFCQRIEAEEISDDESEEENTLIQLPNTEIVLPDDLLCYIFLFIDGSETLIECMKINKQFLSCCISSKVWQSFDSSLVVETFGGSIMTRNYCYYPLQKVTQLIICRNVMQLSKYDHFIHQFGSLKKLSIHGGTLINGGNQFEDRYSQSLLYLLLHNSLDFLEFVSFDIDSVSKLDVLSTQCLLQLKCLKFTNVDGIPLWIMNCIGRVDHLYVGSHSNINNIGRYIINFSKSIIKLTVEDSWNYCTGDTLLSILGQCPKIQSINVNCGILPINECLSALKMPCLQYLKCNALAGRICKLQSGQNQLMALEHVDIVFDCFHGNILSKQCLISLFKRKIIYLAKCFSNSPITKLGMIFNIPMDQDFWNYILCDDYLNQEMGVEIVGHFLDLMLENKMIKLKRLKEFTITNLIAFGVDNFEYICNVMKGIIDKCQGCIITVKCTWHIDVNDHNKLIKRWKRLLGKLSVYCDKSSNNVFFCLDVNVSGKARLCCKSCNMSVKLL